MNIFVILFRALMIIVAAALIIIGCFDENGIRKSKKIALLGIVPLAMFVISLCIV